MAQVTVTLMPTFNDGTHSFAVIRDERDICSSTGRYSSSFLRHNVTYPLSNVREMTALAPASPPTPNDIRHARYVRALLVSDAAVICLVLAVATVLRFGGQPDLLTRYGVVSAVLAVLWMLALGLSGTRSRRVVGRGVEEYANIVLATLQLVGLVAIFALLANVTVSRGYLAVAFPLGLLGLLFNRRRWRRVAAAQLGRGEGLTPVLVVGTLTAAADIAARFAKDPAAGHHVVGICTPAGPTRQLHAIDVDGRTIPIVGIDQAIVTAVRRTGAHTVALAATDQLQPTEIRRLIWELDSLGVDLMIAPGLVDIAEERLRSRPVAGMAMLEVTKPQHDRANSAAKRVFDIVFTLAAMVAMAPVFLLAALAVRLSSPGPIFYVAERIGRGGTTFTMLKFRSMYDGADARAAAMIDADGGCPLFWKAKDDPRITRVGKVLRKLSIDELPQFINVLRGDMSVVGPRPQVRREVDSYDDLVRRRLAVKPGLTGLWQVSGRSDLQREDAIRLDLSYVENWSPIQDLVIIAKTVKTVLRGDGAY